MLKTSWRWVLLLPVAGMLAACGSGRCDPKTMNPCGSAPQSCDAKAKVCTDDTTCRVDADCPNGYQCSVTLTVCYRNCFNYLVGGGLDDYCVPGYRCNLETVACDAVPSCTPNGLTEECNNVTCDASTSQCGKLVACGNDAPCGTYACDVGFHYCRASCADSTHCAIGRTCDVTSGRCS